MAPLPHAGVSASAQVRRSAWDLRFRSLLLNLPTASLARFWIVADLTIVYVKKRTRCSTEGDAVAELEMSLRIGMALSIGGCVLAASARAGDTLDSALARDDRVARVEVVVDENFLQRRRCQRDPDCIAPRVFPILEGGRRGTYVHIAIPEDHRFRDRYQR